MDWTELETSTHQDHVIKHVAGATVLAWFVAGEAAHFLLDIGFLWTVYIDGEMNLLPQRLGISDLDAEELTAADRAELAFDAQLLVSEGREATGLKRFTAASAECLITAVELFAADSRRRITVQCEAATIEIETSLDNCSLTVDERINA